MKNKRPLYWLALITVSVLVLASCGGDDAVIEPQDDDSTEAPGDDSTEAPGDDSTEAPGDDSAEAPGDDSAEAPGDDSAEAPGDDSAVSQGEVIQARANWSTGYFQAYVYNQLLEELGYNVSEPADKELDPSLAYLSIADGTIDFWVNSWYPLHNSWLLAELPDTSRVGDHITVVGNQMLNGSLQGMLITKSFADQYGVTHIDQINDDPEILAAFDADDHTPGNGKAEIFGCSESWTCDDVIESQIAFSGWDNIVQVKAGYDAMFADATQRIASGQPTIIYTYTPSPYLSQLRPGDNVVWLAVEDVLDDSNPTGVEGGEAHDQRPGTAPIPPDQCPAAAEEGTCQIGWIPVNIQVTANSEWLENNPDAAHLFCLVELPILDVTLAIVEQSNSGDESEEFVADLASRWISNNRATVDGWLEQARNAPEPPSCPGTVLPSGL